MGKVCLSKSRGDSEKQLSLLDPQNTTPITIPALQCKRIQLRRTKGWRIPENTIKIDRSTPLGNPFIVGIHGNTEECVKYFESLCKGRIRKKGLSIDEKCIEMQKKFLEYFRTHKEELKGKNLACWCKIENICHGNILLKHINGSTQ